MKIRSLHPVRLLAALAACALTSCAAFRAIPGGRHVAMRLPAQPRNADTWAVLFIGNSYSHGVPREFRRLAVARGIRVRTGQATHDGWTLSRHASNLATRARLRESEWDLVVLQEHSLIPGNPRRRLLEMQSALTALAREARSVGAIPMLMQTWGRRDGNPANPRGGFHEMNHRVRDGCGRAARGAGVALIPVGDAWEREVQAGRAGLLFHADGSHPTSYGNQITASTLLDLWSGSVSVVVE
jgi:hypothetical protein